MNEQVIHFQPAAVRPDRARHEFGKLQQRLLDLLPLGFFSLQAELVSSIVDGGVGK